MTCIVGFTDGERVTIGGDSAGVAGYDLDVRADSKVWAKDGWAFGFTSSFRMGQLLRYKLTPPAMTVGQELEQYMATTFVDAVRTALKDGGYVRTVNGEEHGGQFLVGHHGRLFHVESDFQVAESTRPFGVAGCGGSYALGALHALEHNDLAAGDRVSRALGIAERCSAGVRGPFAVVST